MKQRAFKFSTALLAITLIALGCLCSMAATCGPVRFSEIYGFSMVEFRDEERGAYFLKAEVGGECYGYITDSDGKRVDMLFEVGSEVLYATPVTRNEKSAYFYADMFYDSENSTLTCTLRDEIEGIDIDFTELVFVMSEVDNSALHPYDLISADWKDENDIFILSLSYPYVSCTYGLHCFMLDGGNIIYRTYDFIWTDYGFEIFDKEECVASGEYDFDYKNFAITLTFNFDRLFGEEKPFASYPAITITTDWAEHKTDYAY